MVALTSDAVEWSAHRLYLSRSSLMATVAQEDGSDQTFSHSECSRLHTDVLTSLTDSTVFAVHPC